MNEESMVHLAWVDGGSNSVAVYSGLSAATQRIEQLILDGVTKIVVEIKP